MPNLEQLIARNWPCSRKQARRLALEVPADVPRMLPAERLPWTVDVGERRLTLHDAFHLMLNKPVGCITALVDPTHPTAAAYVRDAPLAAELRPVGRLDRDTTGLLLWTTDGNWLHRLTHPKNQIPRTYHVGLERPFGTPPAKLVLRDGHQPNIVDLRLIAPAEVHPSLRKDGGVRELASITIVGGAYHEVRRIFAALGTHVLSLCRVAFGKWILPPTLAPGAWQAITPDERTPES